MSEATEPRERYNFVACRKTNLVHYRILKSEKDETFRHDRWGWLVQLDCMSKSIFSMPQLSLLMEIVSSFSKNLVVSILTT